MAKQKNTVEETAPAEGADTFQESHGNGENADTAASTKFSVDTPQPQQETIPASKKGKEKPEGAQPEGFILGLLKSYPQYKTLYVDRHGGVFTPGTSILIRKEAILYNNPYYKPNNV